MKREKNKVCAKFKGSKLPTHAPFQIYNLSFYLLRKNFWKNMMMYSPKKVVRDLLWLGE